MARSKFDCVVEAVRYNADGRIEMVRIYERRGSAWSDRILLSRADLLTRMNAGQKFVIGSRVEFMAGTFETGPEIKASGSKDDPVLTTAAQSNGGPRDDLQGVPVF